MRLLRLTPSPKSRRLLPVLIGTACAVALAASVMGTSSSHASPSTSSRAYVPAQLLSAARASPSHVYRVILQGAGARGETQVVSAVRARGVSVGRRLGTVSGASAAVTGRQLLQLSAAKGVAAITLRSSRAPSRRRRCLRLAPLASRRLAWGSAAWGSAASADVASDEP